MMMTYFIKLKKKILRNLSDYGFLVSLEKIITKAFGIFYKRTKTIVYRIDMESSVTNPINDFDFSFRLLNERDNLFIETIEEKAEWLKGKLEYFLKTEQKICMAVFDKEKLIGFYLAGFEKVYIPLLSIQVILKDNEAWGEEIMIDKKYRGRGLASVLKKKIYRVLQDRGIKSLYGCIRQNNAASLKSACKFNLKRSLYVQLFKIMQSKKLIFSEISIDSHERNRTDFPDILFINLYHIDSKAIDNKEKSIMHLKNKKDGEYPYVIKTSDLM